MINWKGQRSTKEIRDELINGSPFISNNELLATLIILCDKVTNLEEGKFEEKSKHKEVIRHLTWVNKDTFFKKCEVNEIFTYNDFFYLYKDVENLAKKENIIIKYCHPESKEYKEHGCFTCKVIAINKKEKEKCNKDTFFNELNHFILKGYYEYDLSRQQIIEVLAEKVATMLKISNHLNIK